MSECTLALTLNGPEDVCAKCGALSREHRSWAGRVMQLPECIGVLVHPPNAYCPRCDTPVSSEEDMARRLAAMTAQRDALIEALALLTKRY